MKFNILSAKCKKDMVTVSSAYLERGEARRDKAKQKERSCQRSKKGWEIGGR